MKVLSTLPHDQWPGLMIRYRFPYGVNDHNRFLDGVVLSRRGDFARVKVISSNGRLLTKADEVRDKTLHSNRCEVIEDL
jgi:hypothetical protein